MGRRFDRSYYQRYYEDPDRQVGSVQSAELLGDFLCAYLKHLEVEVERIVEFGCGLGRLRPVFARHFPDAEYCGVEISAHVCRELGWERGSVVDHDAGETADLVVCQGVLQYLPARDARRAIRNLLRHAATALYLEVLTEEDWADNVDRDRTDGEVYLRPARWYRDALCADFVSCGGGLFVRRDAGVVLFELERG